VEIAENGEGFVASTKRKFLFLVKYETNLGSGLTIVEGGHLHFFGSRDYYYDLDIPIPGHVFEDSNEIEYIERNAVLDLSGFSLRIGIRIKLF
jgi:hypothetical protein